VVNDSKKKSIKRDLPLPVNCWKTKVGKNIDSEKKPRGYWTDSPSFRGQERGRPRTRIKDFLKGLEKKEFPIFFVRHKKAMTDMVGYFAKKKKLKESPGAPDFQNVHRSSPGDERNPHVGKTREPPDGKTKAQRGGGGGGEGEKRITGEKKKKPHPSGKKDL